MSRADSSVTMPGAVEVDAVADRARTSPLPPELAAESARTWDAGTHVPAVPEELRPPASAPTR